MPIIRALVASLFTIILYRLVDFNGVFPRCKKDNVNYSYGKPVYTVDKSENLNVIHSCGGKVIKNIRTTAMKLLRGFFIYENQQNIRKKQGVYPHFLNTMWITGFSTIYPQ